MRREVAHSQAELMVLSIHPRHVRSILSGDKTVELRRTRPQVLAGQAIAIYSTNPESALVAVGRVARLEVASPEDLRNADLLQAAQVSGEEYSAYFAGADRAVALHLREVAPLRNPVSLSQMRERRSYSPPQTWHFFDAAGLRALVGDHQAHAELVGLI